MNLSLTESDFIKHEGRTPKLHAKLREILARLAKL